MMPQKKESTEIFRRMPVADVDLTTDIRVSILAQSPKGGSIILWTVVLLFIGALVWAYFSEIEELTRGAGKVVPARQIQVIQNLEGGILSELLVKIGDVVEKGQLLLRIDETRFSAPYRESKINYLVLLAKISRLQAETNNTDLVISEEVRTEEPLISIREQTLFETRKEEFSAKIRILKEKETQRRQELIELNAHIKELSGTYNLLKREIALTQPLVAKGAVSEVEVLRLQRQASEMVGEIKMSELAIPRVESMLQEAVSAQEAEVLAFSNQAKAEINEAYAKLQSLSATSVALADRLERTSVRSPVRGTVNQIMVNTVGGVIQPGMRLLEIVPLEDTLLIEAKIKPSDIAFLSPEQPAKVSFTAYDFTIYGGLNAKIEYISADSIQDEQGRSFYLVRVRTDKNYLGLEEDPLPIIPGMVATVDIMTGKKTILSYMLKPILRAQKLALRER
jgi:adhesin transport system membrane fusion protein